MFTYCGNNPHNRVDFDGYCYYSANGVWSHDAWEYTGGYEIKPDPGYYAGKTSSGIEVYIAPNTNYFAPPNSMKVYDKRNSLDPNLQIMDSYLITE